MNYAKQTQFAERQNERNHNYDNKLQRKMNNGHLVKTNPIRTQYEANQSQSKPISNPKQTQFMP
jgi:hypothetical protein